MKYFKNILIALILGLGLFGPSCSDFLETEPINQTYGGAFWTSEVAAEQAMAGTYSLLRSSLLTGGTFPNLLTYGELMGGVVDRKGFSNQVKFKDMSFWNPDMGQTKWGIFYKAIAQCNLVLHEVEKLDETLFDDGLAGKEKLMAEAYFIRAYIYYHITRIWGGVPLVTEATTTVSQVITDDGYILTQPRNTEAEVITQCIEDLKYAESKLEYGNPGSGDWAIRANKGSVQALMAHLYLWIDMPDEAQKVAGSMIDNGGYSLVDYNDATAVTEMWEGQSTEGVFEINVNFDQNESYINGLAKATVYKPFIFNLNESGTTWFVKPETIELYDSTDLRLERFFYNLDHARTNCIKYASITYEDEATHTNAHGICNFLVFRLSGIMLLRAEALASLSKFDEARTLLNEIRGRAGATLFDGADSELQYAIFVERQKELVMEGHSYYDRIRCDEWSGPGMSWMSEPRKAAEGYYWGIATSYIQNNPKLTQNLWWSMKSW